MSVGEHVITLDAEGVVHVHVRGVWDMAHADAFFDVLAPVHARARREHGRANILIHMETVQTPMVALHVRSRALAIKRPGDKTAVIVATILSKLQLRRLGSSQGFGLFTDEAAALDWLRGA